MKKTIARLAFLGFCALLLAVGVTFAVSASTSQEPRDDVKNAFDGDRNLYLFSGTRAAEPTGGWQTYNIKSKNTYDGVDFSSGDAMWFDFDYYRDANVIDEVQVRLSGSKKYELFSILSDGTLKHSSSFSTALSAKIQGNGWHHITAKYFQTHSESDGVYSYEYGLTLWLNGKELGTTYISESSKGGWVNTNGYHLYSHNGSAFVNNTNVAAYIYSGTKNGAVSSQSTDHYLMLRDFYVNCVNDAQHAANFRYAPITYHWTEGLRPNATVSGALGDKIHIPANYTAAKDASGNAVSYGIVDVNWYYVPGEAQTLSLPKPVSKEGKLFAGWFADSAYTTQLESVSIAADDTEGVAVYGRQASVALAKWALFPGEQYVSGVLTAGWQTSEFGATDTSTVDLSKGDNAMWWDFDYYRDAGTTKSFDIRFVGNNGSQEKKAAVLTVQNNVLTPVSTYFGTQAGVAIEGDGWHHISIAFRQSTAIVGGTIDHTFTATVYLDGDEKASYTVTNETAWMNNHFHFYGAKLTGGEIDYILPGDSDAAANGIYKVKPYYYGGNFYAVNNVVDTSRFLLYLRNTMITYGSSSPYADISRVTFSAGSGKLPTVTFDAWGASEWSLGYYLPLASDGRLPSEIVDVSVDKTTGRGYGPADYEAMTYELVSVAHYYLAGATGALPTPKLSTSLFGGWYTNPELTGEPVTSYEELSGDVTLYAKFEAVHTAKIIVGGEEIFSGKASVLELPDNAVGYVTADGKVYAAGETLLLDGDITLYGISFSLLEGASIRLSAPSGIRFETLVEKETDELLASLGLAYKIGTLILPTDTLPSGVEFTAAALTASRIKHVELTSEGISLTVDGSGDIHFYAALVEILPQNCVRPFSAISYIELAGGQRIYSSYAEADNSRSVYEVARAAYTDTATDYTVAQKATVTSFIDSVLVLDDRASGMKLVSDIEGYTSPYSFSLSESGTLIVSAAEGASVGNIKTVVISDEVYTRGWKTEDGRLTASYVRGAYMEYTVADNFFDEYTDPFGIAASEYKEMTVTLTNENTYTLTYEYGDGSAFISTFVRKSWGMWMMGALKYVEKDGTTTHTLHGASTDYEFVMVAGNSFSTWRGGNHGAYANISNNPDAVEGDPTTLQNDRLLAIAFYDGKSGEKLELSVGESRTVNGLRVVMYNNIYEKSYTRDNVLFNVMKSYLFNGEDIHVDSELYATKESRFKYIYLAMLPLYKKYSNCMRVTLESGEVVYAKTGIYGDASKPEKDLDAAKSIELWGENNPALHTTVEVRRDEANGWSSENTRLWDMNTSANKVYFRGDASNVGRGTEFHLSTTWSFEYLPEFSYDGEFDYLIGTAAQ